MLYDLTLPITEEMQQNMPKNQHNELAGHIGTHFDVMDKVFPLSYSKCPAIVFDVHHIADRDIEAADVDLSKVTAGMFVAFYTGHQQRIPFGSEAYHSTHPQLSQELITLLLDKGVSIIGVDAGGVRRGKEHTPADQRCADRGVFVVENLCGLESVAGKEPLTIYTFPMSLLGTSGLPCRVLAEG